MKKNNTIKRRNPEQTRARILAAASEMFALHGYAKTGLRDIAGLADVSPALPIRYFGGKAGLFEAALLNTLDLDRVLRAEKRNFGRELARAIFDKQQPITMHSMIAQSIGDAEAAAIAGQFTQQHMIEPIAKWLGPPKAETRAYLIVTISTGLAMFNHHILVDGALRKRPGAPKWLENVVQDLVDGGEEAMQYYFRNRPKTKNLLSGGSGE